MSEKGQVTIPKKIRERMGLRSGTILEFEVKDGKLIGTKTLPQDVFRKWRGRGRLPGGRSVDEYLQSARDPDAHRA